MKKRSCQYCGDVWYRKTNLCLDCDRKRRQLKCREALAMRFSGMKYKDIGAKFGVGIERARQLVRHGARQFFQIKIYGRYDSCSNL